MTIRRSLTLKYALAATVVMAVCMGVMHFATYCCPGHLRAILSVVCFVGIAALALAGYMLARSLLRHIGDVVDEVESISADSMEQRLPMNGNQDELDEVREAFNSLLDRMEASLNSQKMFVSNVSHELRTPLATIIGRLDLAMQRDRTEAYYQEAIAESLQNAWQMSRLIDGLLDLAKADYGKEQVKMERIRLDELLIDVRETVLKSHPEYQIELLFGNEEADDDSSITIRGNAYLLRIAFSNLIENNCKYSANKTSFVQISYWDKWCTVLCSDNGVGMTEQEQRQLFDLFYRGEQSKDAEGHGIGMTLVQKIVNMHQGTITVRSMKGEGTTFLVQLLHV